MRWKVAERDRAGLYQTAAQSVKQEISRRGLPPPPMWYGYFAIVAYKALVEIVNLD